MQRFSTLPDFALMADRFPRGRFCPLLIVLPRLKKRATGDPEGLFWRPRRQETPSRSVFGPFGRRFALRRRLPEPQSHQSVPARKSSTDHPRPTTSTASASSTPAALTRSAIPTRECPGEDRLARALVFPPAIGNASRHIPTGPSRLYSPACRRREETCSLVKSRRTSGGPLISQTANPISLQARKSPGMTGERENLAASFLAVHLNFPHFLCGEIPLDGQKGSCLLYVLNHEVGQNQRIS